MGDILAAQRWSSNADLIADVATLGYIGSRVLDLSYGRGVFWRRFRPDHLVTNDLDRSKDTDEHWDATKPRAVWYDRFDTVVWDGPYRLAGTPDRGDFDDRFGLTVATSWQDRMEMLKTAAQWGCLYLDGKGSTLLVKCQDQVVSGHKVWQARELADAVERFDEYELGMKLVDKFDMVRPARVQPGKRKQVHSRSNTSTLLVFRRTK